MRPSTIPDAEVWPGARRIVMAPPDGDLTNDEIRPVEMLVEHPPDSAPVYSTRLVLEPGDLEQLAAGSNVWVSFYGCVVPFSLTMAPAATGPEEAQ